MEDIAVVLNYILGFLAIALMVFIIIILYRFGKILCNCSDDDVDYW